LEGDTPEEEAEDKEIADTTIEALGDEVSDNEGLNNDLGSL
jgi:hypothetical protein